MQYGEKSFHCEDDDDGLTVEDLRIMSDGKWDQYMSQRREEIERMKQEVDKLRVEHLINLNLSDLD